MGTWTSLRAFILPTMEGDLCAGREGKWKGGMLRWERRGMGKDVSLEMLGREHINPKWT